MHRLHCSLTINSLRPSGAAMHQINNLPIIVSNNGLLPDWHPAIIQTNAGIYCLLSSQEQIQWNFDKNVYTSIQENTFESVVSASMC